MSGERITGATAPGSLERGDRVIAVLDRGGVERFINDPSVPLMAPQTFAYVFNNLSCALDGDPGLGVEADLAAAMADALFRESFGADRSEADERTRQAFLETGQCLARACLVSLTAALERTDSE